MATTQELVETLVQRFPDDAEDLREALEILQKQRIGSCDRLAKLNDNQWQRLGVPIGIETILRDAVDEISRSQAELPADTRTSQTQDRQPMQPSPAAPKQLISRHRQDEDDDHELPLEPFEEEGLRQRGGGKANGNSSMNSKGEAQNDGGERKGLLSPLDLTPPPELDLMWHQLLEDTLPPDKRAALNETWNQVGNDHDKYMMFLEYSSYLRKPEITEEEKEERRKQLEPLMKEFGLRSEEEESSWQGAILWFVLVACILFVASLVYFFYMSPETLHDSQAL